MTLKNQIIKKLSNLNITSKSDFIDISNVLINQAKRWLINEFNERFEVIRIEQDELFNPELILEDDISNGIRNFALTIDMCNMLAHIFCEPSEFDETEQQIKARVIRGRIYFEIKDIMLQKLANICISNGFHCGMYVENNKDAFGIFIPGVGTVRWHLGNSNKALALHQEIQKAVMSKNSDRRAVDFKGQIGYLDYWNYEVLTGCIPQSELNDDTKRWLES